MNIARMGLLASAALCAAALAMGGSSAGAQVAFLDQGSECDAAFRPFALQVLGPDANPAGIAALKAQVSAWYRRENALMSRALPTQGEGWGLGRLDAVGMIFNRLTGLDLGQGPDGIIAANIRPADAPVRYPFIWNAPRQDLTQWPGFAPNGNELFGLVRNLGEVYGVFGDFRPVAGSRTFDFLKTNSANFHGLKQVENLVWKIGAPSYAWPVDQDLAEQGQQLYDANCSSCHGIQIGKRRSLFQDTWKTQTLAVGTDERQYRVIKWTADPGVLRDAKVYLVGKPLNNPSDSISVLSLAVIGSILQNEIGTSLVHPGKDAAPSLAATATSKKLAEAYLTAPVPGSVVYESRVMKGIWAAAPYLHNGSVPTLDDLLKPAAERPVSFEVGNVYDKDRLGLAVKQNNGGRYVRTTTGCGDIASGNSRCGHEFGTNLSPAEKKALLEFMKVL